MTKKPNSTQILVIGGGPAGSTAATLLAREGFDVVLAERDIFPRYHIGESLLPSVLEFLDLLGVRKKIESHGFQYKPGGYFDWGNQQWDLIFGELSGDKTYSFQVIRSEFDQLLLEHAKCQGVSVLEGVEVRKVFFDGNKQRAERALLSSIVKDRGNEEWEIIFDFIIDASGRSGLLASRYLRNRHYHEAFKNVALWGYWKNTNNLTGNMEGSIASVSIPYGWIWAIPLHDGTTSVGVVIHNKTLKEKKAKQSLLEIYQEAITESPMISDLVFPGELVTPVSAETDYSYRAERFAGPGYFLAGDAACFLDPLLSSGVHLAMLGALLASASISSVLRGQIAEETASRFYDKSYRRAYLRFLVFVSSFYNQNGDKDSIFWTAQNLSQSDASVLDLKNAFTNLASGVADMRDVKDSEEAVRSLVVDEMSERIQENLELRQDKNALVKALHNKSQQINQNERFFSEVEGLSVLSPDAAVEGLYVETKPQLRLARA